MRKITPSTLEYKSLCPCFDYSDTLSAGRDAADEGTLMHKALELEDLSILETDEQKECVENALVYLKGIVAGHPEGSLRTVMKELKVSVPILGCNGYIDWSALFLDNTMEIADAKFGRKGALAAGHNLQCACYVLALWEKFPEVTSIRGHIVNARLREATEPYIFERSMKPALEKMIATVVEVAEDPFKKPVLALDICPLCAHVDKCPAYNKLVARVATEIAETQTLPTVYEPAFLTTPEDRAKAQLLAQAMEQWAENIKRCNLDYVKNGGELPGYKMVTRAGKKDLSDTMGIVTRLRETGTMADFDILPTCTLSFTKLAKTLAAVRRCTEIEAKDQLTAVLGTFIAEGPEIKYLQRGKASRKELLQG